jgi:hypothetical protein
MQVHGAAIGVCGRVAPPLSATAHRCGCDPWALEDKVACTAHLCWCAESTQKEVGGPKSYADVDSMSPTPVS